MNTNLFLEDILDLLAAYGRPTINQFSVSATPGWRAAGMWNVEVCIKPRPFQAMDKATNEAALNGGHHVPARCIGRAETAKEAALICLRRCEELLEGPNAKFYEPVSTEDLKRAEAVRFGDAPSTEK
jgi:hypothetical protein